MCYFTCSAQEVTHSHCFYLVSNKSKMVIMRPPALTITHKILQHIKNSRGGPSTPPCAMEGDDFTCTSEGKGTCMSNTTYWESSQTVVFTAATNNTEDHNLKATITWLNWWWLSVKSWIDCTKTDHTKEFLPMDCEVKAWLYASLHVYG